MARTLKIHFLDEFEHGARIVAMGNWNGKALFTPFQLVTQVIGERKEFKKPGIYILKAQADSDRYDEQVYIGESEFLKKRLLEHTKSNKIDFTELVIFTTSDDELDKGSIRYLEHRLIQEAKESGIAEVLNKTRPAKPHLSEWEGREMDDFFEIMKLILPLLGFHMLRKSSGVNSQKKSGIRFFVKSSRLKATMVESEGKFLVLKGSECSFEESETLAPGWRKIRARLLGQKKLKRNKGNYVLSDDVFFDSVSAASSVVLGRQSPGPLMWVDEKGMTFKQHQDQRLES